MEAHSSQGVGSAVEKPNGPVAAAILASGIGSLFLGIFVILSEASEGWHNALELTKGVGPLSGKTTFAVIIYLVSWAVLYGVLGKKDVDLNKAAVVTAVLIGAALLFTFPPFFLLFAPEE